MTGKISKTGYKSNSPDKNNDYNIIPSGNITMKDVPHNVLGIDDLGNVVMMMPGKDYKFEGKKVFEIPMKQKGGNMKNQPMSYPAFLAMGGSPFFYAQTGGFVPPSDAQKVTDVPTDFQFSGTSGNKKYFAKNIQAPGAIGSTNSNTNAEAHRQFLIKQLQSGVKPEDLVTAGHATAAGIQPLSGYYKPSVVYIEPKVTTQTTPQKQPIPLNESDRVEMKQIFPNSGNKYLTYQVPDPNAGYNKSTEKYYDPQTFRPIDPLKSFDNSGNYAPSFLYSDPTQETLAEKYRGTKVATRYDTAKIGQADTVNVNPAILNSKTGYQSGGPVFDKKMIGNFLDEYFKKDKSIAPQGQDTNSFVKNKIDDFTNHLRSNVMKNMITEEIDAVDHFMKYGGNFKAQAGAQVDWYDPNNPLTPRPNNNMQDFTNGPFGGFNNTVPPYVQSMQGAYPGMNVSNNSGTQSGLNLQPGADANDIAYQQYLKQWNDKNKSAKQNDALASGLMTGMNVFNNIAESSRSRQYQKMLRDRSSAENLFPTQKGSRGDYDINSGAFKPNQMTPVSYNKGGTYYMNEKELKQFLAAGGQIEIID